MNLRRYGLATLFSLTAFLTLGCPGPADPEGPSEAVVRHNILGTAYLGQQKWGEAENEFRQSAGLAPDDAVPLNNIAVALVQQGKIDEAEASLQQALTLAPDAPWAHYNYGLIEKNRGNFDEAAIHFEAVQAADPEDLLTQYNLGVVYSRQDRPEETERAFRNALARDPAHVSSLYGLGQFLLRSGNQTDGERLIRLSQKIRARSGLDQAVGSQYGEQGFYAMGVDYPGDVMAAPKGIPVQFTVAFEATLETAASGRTAWAVTRLGVDREPALLVADGPRIRRLTPAGLSEPVAPVTPQGVPVALAAGDLDNDGSVDLVAAIQTATGIDFVALRGEELEARQWSPPFATAATGTALSTDMTLLDRDHDGDLDLFACWTSGGSPTQGCLIATNDGSGAFESRPAEEHGVKLGDGGTGPVTVAFSDIDNDRDVDLLVLGPDGMHVLTNQRDDTYLDVSDDSGLGAALAGNRSLAVADLNKDGWMDLLIGGPGGTQLLLNRHGRFKPANGFPSGGATDGVTVFDADNDGFLDVVRGAVDSDARADRNLGRGAFDERSPMLVDIAGAPQTAFDVDGDGDLDLLLAGPGGKLTLLSNEGGNANAWIDIESIALNDNKFGIGAKVEVLAGALRQKFEVTDTLPVHMGLAERTGVESVRHLWPSGVLQDEVEQPTRQAIEITQLDRKGTSCPLLYAWSDGGWQFVTDFLGGSAVGFQTAPGTFSTPDTDEYVSIPGGIDEDDTGRLRLRLNNQLEEVIWFDHVELVVVDHPEGTYVYPNERLMPGPPYPEHRLFASGEIRPIVAARQVERDRDVTRALRNEDRLFAEEFRLLPFKGYAELHTLELDLGRFDRGERVILLLDGWIDYADSSANIAAAQAGATIVPPRLSVADGDGGFRVVDSRMGFPAGLPKTMSVDLSGRFPSSDHRIRIATSMRIHWDRARVMVGGRDVPVRETRLRPESAVLRHGGFPRPTSPDGEKPDLYDPLDVEPTSTWKAHSGSYTGFGDVRDLLLEIDDRFVTTKAGDEVELVFRSPGTVPSGWTRSYLLFADGFGKDMDANSAANDQVGPMPFHGMPTYPYPADIVPPVTVELSSSDPPRIVLPSRRGWPGAVPQILAAVGEDAGRR